MADTKLSLKKLHVTTMRGLASVLRGLGIMAWLDKRRENRTWHWIRSLFAIHDIDQMIDLDVPWWTYQSIDFVSDFLSARPNSTVFEYGSGASTVWLSKRAGAVISVEHDQGWFELVSERTAQLDNVQLTHVPADTVLSSDDLYHSQKEGYRGISFEAYAKQITKSDQTFDVIVVDGRARQACLMAAIDCLKPDGIIVFDNTKRARYRAAMDRVPLRKQIFGGLAPSLPYPDETTVLSTLSDKI